MISETISIIDGFLLFSHKSNIRFVFSTEKLLFTGNLLASRVRRSVRWMVTSFFRPTSSDICRVYGLVSLQSFFFGSLSLFLFGGGGVRMLRCFFLGGRLLGWYGGRVVGWYRMVYTGDD